MKIAYSILVLSVFVETCFGSGRAKETSPAYLTSLDNPKSEASERFLASGNKEEDLAHYRDLDRRLGVDIGMMMPFGDFQKDFSSAPLIGLHFTWEAIAPLCFSVRTLRSSTSHKNGAEFGKLTVSTIALGAIATFPVARWMPFVRLEGAFNFNDVSFNAARVVTSGNDTFLTSVGVNAGLGWDFIVGRELSFGMDATYHYSVPKKLTLSDGSLYDLGSSFASFSFRVNF